jgi:hypothetical protein
MIDPEEQRRLQPIDEALTPPTDERERCELATRSSLVADAATREPPTRDRQAAIDTFGSPAEATFEPPGSFPTTAPDRMTAILSP